MPLSIYDFYCFSSFVSISLFSATHVSAPDCFPFVQLSASGAILFLANLSHYQLLLFLFPSILCIRFRSWISYSTISFGLQEFRCKIISVTILLNYLFLFQCLRQHAQTGDLPVLSRLELERLLPMASRPDAQLAYRSHWRQGQRGLP